MSTIDQDISKAVKVINSCKDLKQFQVAIRFVEYFYIKWREEPEEITEAYRVKKLSLLKEVPNVIQK